MSDNASQIFTLQSALAAGGIDNRFIVDYEWSLQSIRTPVAVISILECLYKHVPTEQRFRVARALRSLLPKDFDDCLVTLVIEFGGPNPSLPKYSQLRQNMQ